MDPLLATLILIGLALLGSRFSFSGRRVPQGPRLLFRTGTHFLVLGFLLGPSVLALLTPEATRGLFPFLALGLGWVGFHFGLQFEWGSLRHFRWTFHFLAFGQAVLTFLFFLGLALAGVAALGGRGEINPVLVVGAAATASVTTPAGIAMVSSNFMVRGRIRDLLFFIGSVDAVVGILALQITYALFRPTGQPGAPLGAPQPTLVAAAAGVGIVLGILFVWLARRRPRPEELVLYVLGVCALAAGLALQWGLSPLFVSMVMGAVVANWGGQRHRVFALLQRWEKPVYLSFLLLAGALLGAPTPLVLLLAVAYTLLRGVAKVVSAAGLVRWVPLGFDVPRRLGLGLLPQGGISLAMATSGVLTYAGLSAREGEPEMALFTIVVLGVMLSELAGPYFTVQLLRRAGEITPQVEAALAAGDQRSAERAALKRPGGAGRTPGGRT